jgi:DNA repair exonuclease SbcCD nuclease subunit
VGDLCEEMQIDYVCFLGDLYESWRLLDVDVINATTEGLIYIRNRCRNMYLLCGNHDQYSRRGDIVTPAPFSSFCDIIVEPTIRSDLGLTEPLKVAFQPFTYNHDLFRRSVQDMEPVDLFLFHQPLAEAELPGSSMILGKGLSVNDLPLNKVRLCIGADIHKRQRLHDKVLYVGSPMQLDFGDRGEKRGFTFIDTEDWVPKFIESDAPKFFEFKSADEFWECTDLIVDKDFVRVTCSPDEGRKIIDLHPLTQIIPLKQEVEYKQRLQQNLTDTQVVETFADKFRGNLDKEKLVLTGLQFLSGDD